MTLKEIEITRWDNRGSEDYPFGFVYFSDDYPRVGYAKVDNEGKVFGSNWGTPTPRQYILAWNFLSMQFPEIFKIDKPKFL